ncbi:uncharacterized protein LOC124170045 [Ischnura elegans]|uniref:uncharacterized protein LOC124170045 n=1 Tax=Ischnura elegans TaxID=197161 RepID=UPI001ED86803|nr:uncharacterized protein LOC124170045 [Ischnura elegans]
MNTVPKFEGFSIFLETRIHALDASKELDSASTSASQSEARRDFSSNQRSKTRSLVHTSSTKRSHKNALRCLLCSNGHPLSYCSVFKSMMPNERKEQVHKHSLCFNCLSKQHGTRLCKSVGRCLVCNQKHHTLLHQCFPPRTQGTTQFPTNSYFVSESPALVPPAPVPTEQAGASSCSVVTKRVVLLATVCVKIEAPSGKLLKVRALMDTASDSSFVSEWVVQTLQLRKTIVNVPVTGVQGCETGVSTSAVNLRILSSFDPRFELKVQALVLRKLTSLIPSNYVQREHWPHLTDITLADPDFAIPSKIDLILGADVCGPLFLDGFRQGPAGSPNARLTPFGWVLLGPVECSSEDCLVKNSVTLMHIEAYNNLTAEMQRFWEVEEVPSESPMSEEDTRCENHFKETHTRNSDGRYVVRLPLKADVSNLASSRSSVLRLFQMSEKRLATQSSIKQKYIEFMSEYFDMNHMEAANCETASGYYMPHHAVVKNRDQKGKIRVVFNASFKTASGYSLNDLLLSGPKLQPDLWIILTRWRFFRVAFTADIIKMYRQIRMHPDDMNLQRIVWRCSPSEPIKDYRLTTVTYGTASAPFLALRVLRQLAQDEQATFPIGAKVIENHMYIDDILSGANTLEEALEVREQLVDILKSAGFHLSKWASNSTEICPDTRIEHKVFTETDKFVALGLHWYPETDAFHLRTIKYPEEVTLLSKRIVLSDVARLFDPLGWMAPVLVFAKVFMQDLWLANLEWDQLLPVNLAISWQKFRSSLKKLELISVPRWIQFSNENLSNVTFHGFSDASERAYAAAVYIRVSDRTHGVSVNLLVAKTKVAPVKTISVPRLELCAAVLLTRLLVKLIGGLRLEKVPAVFAWTDSKVTLSWIRGHASKWKPFVAHRVSEIQSALPTVSWRYVCTAHNPADAATRGIDPDELIRHPLWWNGPHWLAKEETAWSREPTVSDGSENVELKGAEKLTCHVAQASDFGDIFLKYSCILRLLRIISFCLRFLYNYRNKDRARLGHITAEERAAALDCLIKCSQSRYFGLEFDCFKSSKPLPKSSPLLPLQPFLDEKGIIRVGGRLNNAVLSYDERHPIIIAKQCHLALLLARHAHAATLHGGQQLTRCHLAQKYWIIRNRVLVKQVIRQCGVCAKFRTKTAHQLMGDLPVERLKPQKAFSFSGVDFAGPVLLRTTKGRGHKCYKGYICLFVCMSTKAVHLECVSDLSSNAFTLAFRRFISRRGRCLKLFSDNATNFRGADRELRSLFKAASSFYEKASADLSTCGTDWIFNPPYAPYFGGLWEAGVKSVKHHLRRVNGDQKLTSEEISTPLCHSKQTTCVVI